MLNLLKSSLISRCRDSVKKTERQILEEGTRGILESWTLMLWELAEDFADAESTILQLQSRIKMKEKIHEEDLQIFEDIQRHEEEEQKKQIQKEKTKYQKIVQELRTELQAKEEELQAAMEIKSELIDRINNIFKKKNSIRLGKSTLLKENETLLEELEKQRQKIEILEQELEETKKMLADKTDECFKEGIRVGRKLAAIEEIGVLEELEILKDIEKAIIGQLERRDSDVTLITNLHDAD